MWRNVFKILLCVVIALILGIGSAFWMIRTTSQTAWLQNGAWRVNLAIGSEELGMYSRAAVAFGGLFAMQKSEAIYFSASTDEEGQLFLNLRLYNPKQSVYEHPDRMELPRIFKDGCR
jgi:hypothetical protein